MVHEATGAARRTRELVLSFLKKTTAARTRSKLAELHISSLGGLVARLAAGAVVAASATFDGNTPPGVIDYALPAVTAPAEAFVAATNRRHRVVVWSLEYCEFCWTVFKLLDAAGVRGLRRGQG